VIVPKENEKDLRELLEHVQHELKFIFADRSKTC
jgi:ATP-dependent Lon protease